MAGQDERPSSKGELVWTVVTVALWLIAIGLAVWLIATTLTG